MVDDSLVRGTTSSRIVAMLRDCGAKEVHFCLSSPPVTHSCYYGIDTSNEKELLACSKTTGEIRKIIGADGLHYLSQEGLLDIFGDYRGNFCAACFDGKYPVDVCGARDTGKFALE
jgi:amidophosphoribosyltransferase